MLQAIKWTLKYWVPASIIIATFAAATIYGELFSQRQNGLNREKPLLALDRLKQKYATVSSLHLIANAKIALYGENFAAGSGTFEYWAQGDHYRVKCRTDKHLKLSTDLDVAYNGERLQFLDERSGILSYRSEDDVRSHAALPNPLFLLVDYLSNDDDDCVLCRIRLTDLKSDNPRWKTRSQSLEVKGNRRDSNNRVITDLEIPSGKLNGQALKLRIKMSGNDEENALPSHIERLRADGQIVTSVEFMSFMENTPLPVPRDLVILAFDEKGKLALRVEYTVTHFEINKPIPSEVFTMGFDKADGVWDSDNKKFVKEKPIRKLKP